MKVSWLGKTLSIFAFDSSPPTEVDKMLRQIEANDGDWEIWLGGPVKVFMDGEERESSNPCLVDALKECLAK